MVKGSLRRVWTRKAKQRNRLTPSPGRVEVVKYLAGTQQEETLLLLSMQIEQRRCNLNENCRIWLQFKRSPSSPLDCMTLKVNDTGLEG